MLEQSKKKNGHNRNYYAEESMRNVVFDSSIDWKPVQSAKRRCNVICPRSFQNETSYIVLNLVKPV